MYTITTNKFHGAELETVTRKTMRGARNQALKMLRRYGNCDTVKEIVTEQKIAAAEGPETFKAHNWNCRSHGIIIRIEES